MGAHYLGVEYTARLLDITLPSGGIAVVLAEAYIDESGTHKGSSIFCLGGYLFEKDGAAALAQEWQAVLEKKGISFFHMNECCNQQGEFANLSKTECDQMARKMIALTREHSIHGFGVEVVEDDYDHIMPNEFKRVFGSAYAFCTAECITMVRRWAQRTGTTGQVSYFFESGADRQGEANRILKEMFSPDRPHKEGGLQYAGHGFYDKRIVSPLQTADILAYRWYVERSRQIEGSSYPMNCRHVVAHVHCPACRKWLIEQAAERVRDAEARMDGMWPDAPSPAQSGRIARAWLRRVSK